MKRLIILIGILGCFIYTKAHHNLQRSNTVDTPLILKNAFVLDVEKGKFIIGKSVVVVSGKIVAISTKPKIKGSFKTVDLKGKYLMPGLIDGHVHVTANRKNNIENTFNHLYYLLKYGITSVRDAGGDGAALLQAKTEIEIGKRNGPDIYFSSFMAGDWYYNRNQNLRKEPYSPWEQLIVPGVNLDSAMAVAKACGATGVKLYHSFDRQFLPKVVNAAKKHGLKVWGHTMLYPALPTEVVQSGVEVLSHVYMLETMKKPDTLFYRRTTPNAYRDSVVANIDITQFCQEMKKKGAILEATICVSVERSPWVLPLLKRVHQQGVKISAGTDQIVDINRPYPHLIDELSYFVNSCGFTNAEAIRSATIIAAEVIGQEKHIGTVEVGKKADLIVLKENPLLDIKALGNVDMVIKSGEIIN